MANQDYIAIYPVSPCLQIGDEKINMLENLARFKKQLVESLQGVLNGKKRAVLIRIAHVGISGCGHCENIYQDTQKCYFVPTTEDEESWKKFKKVKYWVNSGQDTQCLESTICCGFHADPLIFAQAPNVGLVKSITYGENDVETMLAWLDIPFKQFGEETPKNSVDAYVLFNSTFLMRDYGISFQVIHGGFRAKDWNDISYFRNNAAQNPGINGVTVNPHWIRGDDEGVLMIVSYEDYEETWFFSLPIAPPPLFFKTMKERTKLQKSTQMINELFKNDYRKRLHSLINELGFNNNYDIRKITAESSSFVEWYRTAGKNKTSNTAQEIDKLKRGEGSRIEVAYRFLTQYGFTPQAIRDLNYSYLDLYLTKPEGEQLKPSWYIAILLLLLIDNYLKNIAPNIGEECRKSIS